MKEVLRLIATSRTYESESVIMPEEAGEFVFKGPIRKRLTAEQFLDSIRTITEVWPKPERGALKKGVQGGQLLAVMEAHEIKEWVERPIRTVLTSRDPLQAALGRPNREQIVSARPDVVTTLEAINLANGPELSNLLTAGAKQLAEDLKGAALVDRVFLGALNRLPSSQEREVADQLIGSTTSGIEDLLWMVFMLPEFLYVN
jgi:hypothetical protein